MQDRHSKDYELARKRVRTKQEFYNHLIFFVIFSAFMVLLNAVTTWGHWWFFWPVIGWGIAVGFHYFDVFGLPDVGQINDEDWEERAVEREMRKMGYPGREQERPGEKLELKELKRMTEQRQRGWRDDEIV